MRSNNVVIVGASLAATRVVQGLQLHGYDGNITVIGEETHAPYDRPPLTKEYLTSQVAAKEPNYLTPTSQTLNNVDLFTKERATSLDARNKILYTDKRTIAFDSLVITTGVRAKQPLGGNRLLGVHTIRTFDDARRFRNDLLTNDHVLIVGFGLIGAELASSARALGKKVTIVDSAPMPSTQFGATYAATIRQLHLDNGVNIITSSRVVEFLGKQRVKKVRLNNGRTLEANLVAFAAGCVPNIEWLSGSGLPLGDGVEATSTLEVAPNIFAAGDVASWVNPLYGRRMRVEHWTNASEQGLTVAYNILHPKAQKAHVTAPYYWSDQHGQRVQFIGDMSATNQITTYKTTDTPGRQLHLYGRNGFLIGVLGIDSVALTMKARRYLLEPTEWRQAVESIGNDAESRGYLQDNHLDDDSTVAGKPREEAQNQTI